MHWLWSHRGACDDVQMHCGVVDVSGTCCIYLRATRRPWMHWLWSHGGTHDEVQMHCKVVDVMVTCWSYLRATHMPWMHWLWSHLLLWISDELVWQQRIPPYLRGSVDIWTTSGRHSSIYIYIILGTHPFMDGHHMFYIYGTLIILIIYPHTN